MNFKDIVEKLCEGYLFRRTSWPSCMLYISAAVDFDVDDVVLYLQAEPSFEYQITYTLDTRDLSATDWEEVTLPDLD